MVAKLISDNTENVMNDLKKIDPEILKEYISIRKQKLYVVKNQRFDESAKLRDREREMDRKYPILDEHKSFIFENMDWIIRDLKINDILE
jgi:hypothetical protein